MKLLFNTLYDENIFSRGYVRVCIKLVGVFFVFKNWKFREEGGMDIFWNYVVIKMYRLYHFFLWWSEG